MLHAFEIWSFVGKENDKPKSGVKINEVVGQKNSSSER